MSTEPISDEDLDRVRLYAFEALGGDADCVGFLRLSPETLSELIARIDAAENRVCRWERYAYGTIGVAYTTGCAHDVGTLLDAFCPHCGGRIVVEGEGEE